MIETKTLWLTAMANPRVSDGPGPAFLTQDATANVRRVHEALGGYAPTPLVSLPALAEQLGVRAVLVKDESHRFGLNAFKGLGGVYALTRVVCRELGLSAEETAFQDLQSPAYQEKIRKMVFVTATDGNHGKGIAWAAGQLGCEAHVYMPRGSSEVRAQAIRDVGKAEVLITELCYDDAVRHAAAMAEEHGWFLVQDSSWDGYEEIPSWIAQGYTTMASEALNQMASLGYDRPTHVFLQAGVGAMAGGVLGYLANRLEGNRPIVSIVEPENVACIYRSAYVADGKPHPATGSGETIMAGLNCGEPCTITWPILRDFAGWYFTCPDFAAAHGMRVLAKPLPGDERIVSGESGAATTGLLHLLCEKEGCRPIRQAMSLDETAVVLLFNTEGDTDPEHYRQVVEEGRYPVPET